MSLSPTDQRDLIEPLFSGLREHPPWQTFLHRLIARTGAERAGIRVRGPGDARLDRIVDSFAASRSAREARRQVGDSAPPGLRPLRVYTYAELTASSQDMRERQRLMSAAMIAYGRWMRIPTSSGWNAWIMLEHSTRDFTAGDGALLSGLGPFIASAIELLRELDLKTRRAEIAEQALEQLGISQALIDRDRRVIGSDGAQPGDLPPRPTAPVPLARSSQLTRALSRLTSGEPGHALVVDPAQADQTVLLHAPPPSAAPLTMPGAVVAVTRSAGQASTAALARSLVDLHGLSPREADLAAALARGEELVPAGARLGLTPETTRNYSKRIYAKTGTRGQADLVRLVLTGLAPLATEE